MDIRSKVFAKINPLKIVFLSFPSGMLTVLCKLSCTTQGNYKDYIGKLHISSLKTNIFRFIFFLFLVLVFIKLAKYKISRTLVTFEFNYSCYQDFRKSSCSQRLNKNYQVCCFARNDSVVWLVDHQKSVCTA